jgi:hypothetical protein
MVFTIGIDPHKRSHLAAVLDEREQLLDDCASAPIVISVAGS